MKIRTISYQKVFPLASYVNEKIGIEIELDEHDDWNEAFDDAKELVNNWGTKLEPHIDVVHWDNVNGVPSTASNHIFNPPPATYIQRENIEIAIDNATTIHQLDLLMGDAAKYGLAKELNEKKRKLQG
jgi:hypothetical protein